VMIERQWKMENSWWYGVGGVNFVSTYTHTNTESEYTHTK
jgi:hypothetical protein